MSVAGLMNELRSREVRLWADGDRLCCDAPAGVLTPSLRQELHDHKDEILQFLRSVDAVSRQQRAIVPLQASGSSVPVFAVAGHNGDVFTYKTLVQELGTDQPFFGLQPPGLDGHTEPLTSVIALAKYFADQVAEFHPAGPCVIAGFCAGGTVAFALACELRARGRDVQHLIMFAPAYPPALRLLPWRQKLDRLLVHATALGRMPPTRWSQYVREMRARLARQRAADAAVPRDETTALRERLEHITVDAVKQYRPGRFDGSATLMIPSRAWLNAGAQPLRWRRVIRDARWCYGHDGTTMDVMLRGSNAPVFAQFVTRTLLDRRDDQLSDPHRPVIALHHDRSG